MNAKNTSIITIKVSPELKKAFEQVAERLTKLEARIDAVAEVLQDHADQLTDHKTHLDVIRGRITALEGKK